MSPSPAFVFVATILLGCVFGCQALEHEENAVPVVADQCTGGCSDDCLQECPDESELMDVQLLQRDWHLSEHMGATADSFNKAFVSVREKLTKHHPRGADAGVLLATASNSALQQDPNENDPSGNNNSTQDPHPRAPAAAPARTAVSSAAADAGVVGNSEDDLQAFISATIFNSAIVIFSFIAFSFLRTAYPKIYMNNFLAGHVKADPGTGCLSWIGASWSITTQATDGGEDIDDWIALDSVLLIDFCSLCIRIFFWIGMPLLLVEAPLNFYVGGPVAGRDYLSYFSFGNVADGSWLYLFHAFMVWYVVLTVTSLVHAAQQKFLKRRFEWLHMLPEARATTILLEGIPDDLRSDEELRKFFVGMFGKDKVRSASVMKTTGKLRQHWQALRVVEEKLAHHDFTGTDDPALQSRCQDLRTSVSAERARILEAAVKVGPGSPNLYCGFVTFRDRVDAEVAQQLELSNDGSMLQASAAPPEPKFIRWRDLAQEPGGQVGSTVIGVLLIALLYVAYLPLVVSITNTANLVRVPDGALSAIWEGLAPTIGLQVVIMFLPSVLLWIFRQFFTLRADAYAQHFLQQAYFWFQIVFVVLVTAIGTNVVDFTVMLIGDPFSIPGLLAETLPQATHFYMNFLVLQWAATAQELLRRTQLLKYHGLRSISEDEDARAKAEPEDQDYYGLGGRMARLTIHLVIGIVYSTMAPTISLICLINFLICRLVYGYLLPFAERKKPDLGGIFWSTSLQHIFVGLGIYTVVMAGVLARHAANWWPWWIVVPTIPFVAASAYQFDTLYRWQRLPFNEVTNPPEKIVQKRLNAPRHFAGEYIQPELRELAPDAEAGPRAAGARSTVSDDSNATVDEQASD